MSGAAGMVIGLLAGLAVFGLMFLSMHLDVVRENKDNRERIDALEDRLAALDGVGRRPERLRAPLPQEDWL